MDRFQVEIFNQFCRRFFAACRTAKASGSEIPAKDNFRLSKKAFWEELKDYYSKELFYAVLDSLTDAKKLNANNLNVYFHPELEKVKFATDKYDN